MSGHGGEPDRARLAGGAKGAPQRTELANGLEVVSSVRPGLHDAAILFGVRAGSRYEPAEFNGISHVLEHMMFRGCDAYPSPRALNLAIEELGGTLDAVTHVDFTTYELTLPAETFLEGVARFGEILRAPLLLDLALEKKILREELLEDLDEDGHDVDIDNLSRRLLFGRHGLGHTITGTLEGIERLGVDDLRRFLARHYVAKNAVLAAAGPFDEAAFHGVVRQQFGSMASGERTAAVAPPAFDPRRDRFAFVRDPGSQSDIRMCFPAFGEGHPDLVALELLLRVLDDGMGSRLPHRLRDELGLVYDAFASLDPYEDAGIVDFGGSVEHGKVLDLLRELSALTDRLRDERVPEDELARVRRRYQWDLDRTLDDAHGIASFHAVRSLFRVPDSIAGLHEAADRVSPDDLLRVARTVFAPGAMHVAVVGGMTAKAQDKVRSWVAQR